MADPEPAAAAQPRGAAVLHSEVQSALDRIVADSLPLGAAAVAAIFGFFTIVDAWISPPEFRLQIAAVDAFVALASLAIFFAVKRGRVPSNRSHAVALLIGLLALANQLHAMYVKADPREATYTMVIVLGAGSIMLSSAFLIPLLVAAVAGYVAVAFVTPTGDWTTFGLSLVAACGLSLVVQAMRLRTYRRLESLRITAERAGLERDVREQALESAVQAAWESEERYRRLVEQAPDAFLVHSEGKVIYANPAAISLFGASSMDELLGIDSLSLVHPDDVETVKNRNRRIEIDGRAVEALETRIRRLDGGFVDVETTGQPISFMGRVANQSIIRDMTDRKRAEAERRLAQDRLAEIARLQEIDRMKTQFVNTLSHELRTPLTPIKVQLHLLKAAHASGDLERQTRSTEMLDRNVARMAGLIDELLEVARLQAGTLKLDLGKMSLSETVRDALDSFRDVAKQNGIDVESNIDPHVSVDGDARRLTQVLYNLLNNALKFTPKGGHIRVDVTNRDGNAVVRVSDSGIGIKAEDITRLFEPFSQLHDTMQKTNAGTGLGLYICKGIVDGHGGRIWCESPGSGKGSTFAFEMPLVSGAEAETAPS